MRALAAAVGAWFISRLIGLFGRSRLRGELAWLAGPVGTATIGDRPYEEVALAEGLAVERNSSTGGLIPDFDQLRGDAFDPSLIHPLVREFYEHTASFAMDVWSQSYFPTNIGLYLLVTTISRQVNQLNFPLSPLDTAHGMSSEIISLCKPDGTLRYTGWFRTLAGSEQRVLYTGFYMIERSPTDGPCVKVVFPMPNGNASVLLKPSVDTAGGLILDSSGRQFGDAGFYRVQAMNAERMKVWHVRTLKELFHVYVDEQGVLRCDHTVRFLGLPVLRLHYKIFRTAIAVGR
jgi:hypothetical protein